MASLDDLITVGNSVNKNMSQLILAINEFFDLYNSVISVAHGGTGNSSLTANSVLTGNGTNPIVAEPLFVCTDAGNVGIGTASPSNKLSVTGNVNITGNLGLGITSAATLLDLLGVNGNTVGVNGIKFQYSSVAVNGNYGQIFHNASSTTDFGAVVQHVNSAVTDASISIGGKDSVGIIVFSTNTSGNAATERVRIDSSGLLTASNSISGAITRSTAKNSTSGTTIDFPSIPSWVKKITVIFNGVSLAVGDDIIIQVGTGGTPQATNYISSGAYIINGGAVVSSGSATSKGFRCDDFGSNADVRYGSYTIVNHSSNIWICTGSATISNANGYIGFGVGQVSLSGTLDIVRITTAGGNAFDAGSINIMYEG